MLDYTIVEEPYYELVAEGHALGTTPTIDDIELQLRRSIDSVGSSSGRDVIFERCPLDFLGYLVALRADAETLRYWFQESRDAVATLQAVVFVPVEQPDRVALARDDLPKLRMRVDRDLRDGLLDDSWGFGISVHECHGPPATRAAQVISWMDRHEIVGR